MTATGTPVLEIMSFGLSAGAVIALLALGLVLVYRTTGVLNFGQWAFGLVGVVVYVLIARTGLGAAISIPAAVAVAAGCGVLANRLVFLKASRASPIIIVMLALALGELLSGVAIVAVGYERITLIPPWLPTDTVAIGRSFVRVSDIITFLFAITVAASFLVWFRRTRTGNALRALAQNREAAALAGIDEARYSSLAWAMGTGFATLGLLLVLPHVAGSRGGAVSPVDFTAVGGLMIAAFGAALVGGLVSMPMTLFGGLFFGVVKEGLILAPDPLSDFRTVIAELLVILLLLLRVDRLYAFQYEREALGP